MFTVRRLSGNWIEMCPFTNIQFTSVPHFSTHSLSLSHFICAPLFFFFLSTALKTTLGSRVRLYRKTHKSNEMRESDLDIKRKRGRGRERGRKLYWMPLYIRSWEKPNVSGDPENIMSQSAGSLSVFLILFFSSSNFFFGCYVAGDLNEDVQRINQWKRAKKK